MSESQHVVSANVEKTLRLIQDIPNMFRGSLRTAKALRIPQLSSSRYLRLVLSDDHSLKHLWRTFFASQYARSQAPLNSLDTFTDEEQMLRESGMSPSASLSLCRW
jgi:hypothetical protein